MGKKIILGVFAHPDDEAMGPAATLLKSVEEDAELHLISVTAGSQGANPDKVSDLGSVREQEWRQAGQLLGATSMHLLGYEDGHLNNIDMIQIAEKITAIATTLLANTPIESELEFITLDLNGYTGHIDHIVVARAVCQVFYSLKAHDARFTRVRLACLPHSQCPNISTSWIFMEAGRNPAEVSEIINVPHLKDRIIKIIRTHHSQRADGEARIQMGDVEKNYLITLN